MKDVRMIAIVTLALAACGDGEQTAIPTATIDTLPNGALLVHNTTQPMWDSAAAWRLVEEIGRAHV